MIVDCLERPPSEADTCPDDFGIRRTQEVLRTVEITDVPKRLIQKNVSSAQDDTCVPTTTTQQTAIAVRTSVLREGKKCYYSINTRN